MSTNSPIAKLPAPDSYSSNPFLDTGHGKPSKIFDYCVDPIRKDRTCIWLCRKRGRCSVAWDVVLEDLEKSSLSLRAQNRWWSRYSFYNYVGVQHVKIKFLEHSKDRDGFRVFAHVVDNTDRIKNLESVLHDIPSPKDFYSCGVDIKGHRHDDDIHCDNSDYDEIRDTPMCRVKESASCRQTIRNLKWTPAMLEYYWLNGLNREGFRFLEQNGFVWSYKALSEDCYSAAEYPYGKSVNALELISGWRVMRLLWAVFAAIVCDFCIVAAVTLLSGSIESGLSAGSYAVGIEALLLALSTLLSTVLP